MNYKDIIKSTIRKLKINIIAIRILSLLYYKDIEIDYNNARKELEEFSHNPNSSCFRKKEICDNPQFDLQIIVPVYNVEKYVKKCLDSIICQETEYKYKVIIVDDGSTDKSKNIVDQYNKYDNFDVVHQENAGLSEARNKGLNYIDANYVMFLDSDDFIEKDAVQNLLSCAYRHNADLVQGTYYNVDSEEQIVGKFDIPNSQHVSSIRDLHGYAWGTIYKNIIFKSIIFPPQYLYEDTLNILYIFPYIFADNMCCWKISDKVYNYRINPAGITNIFSNKPRNVESFYITDMLVREYYKNVNNIDDTYIHLVLSQIIMNYKRTKRLPINIQKDIFSLTKLLLEDLSVFEDPTFKNDILVESFRNNYFDRYCLYCKLQ